MALQNIGILLFTLSFLQSLSIPPWLSFHGEAFAFASIFFLLAHELKKNKKPTPIPKSSLFFLFFLFLAISIQFFAGKVLYSGDLFIAYIYIYASALAAIIGSRADEFFILKLSFAITFISIASVFIALNQTLQVHSNFFLAEYPSFRRSGANIGQVNNLGTLLAIGITSTIYIYKKIKISQTTTAILVFTLIIGISLTESRTALLNISILYLITIFKQCVRFNEKTKLTFLLLFLFLLFYFIPKFVMGYHEIETGNHIPNTTSSMRIEMWKQLISAAMEKPFFGWGFFNLSEALNSVQHNFEVTLPFTYAHNILIDLAIWFGFPAAATIISYCLWKVFLHKKILITNHKEINYCIFITIIITVHSLLEYPFAYIYFLIILFFCLSFIETKVEASNKPISIDKTLYVSLFIYFIFSTTILIDYIYAEENFRKARFQGLGYSNSSMQEERFSLLNQIETMNLAHTIKPISIDIDKDFEIIKFTALRYPRFHLQKNYAIALSMKGDIKESERQLNIIKNMHGLQKFKEAKIETIKKINTTNDRQ